jgi:hypothetical protein
MNAHDGGTNGEHPLPHHNPQEKHEGTADAALSDAQRAIQNAHEALAALQQQALLDVTSASIGSKKNTTPTYTKASTLPCPSKQDALVQMRIHLEKCYAAPDAHKPANTVNHAKHEGLASIKMPVLTRW